MSDISPNRLNDALTRAPSLAALSGRRTEFAKAERVWSDVLEPELSRREESRKATIRAAITRSIIGAGIPIFITILLMISTLVSVDIISPGLIFLVLVSGAIVSATAWVKVFTMKSQTKQLILSAACEPFGFTYDTLHPDLSGIVDLKTLASRAKELNAAYSGKMNSTVNTPLGAINMSSTNGPDAPTPAFEILKTVKLLPGHSRLKFEDLISGERAGTRFALVEAKLETGGKNSKTVFQGILVHVEYPERFLGRTVIARSGWWKRGRYSGDLKKVDLISRELEEAFTVYSTDQVEA
ncbi:MAG TPA: hypothetical protein DDZ20_08925, partial [Hyphomonas sp.]|nr:hypothetical protein [Hyphomonas sp.]